MKFASKSSCRGPKKPSEEAANRPQRQAEPVAWTARTPGWLVLLAGWALPQLLLLGPALVGRTVNLPVDLLSTPHLYLPATPEYEHVVPFHGIDLLDLLLGFADCREFSAKEFRAGRLPLWQPANFAGAPFANWPKYSPFELPFYVAHGPVTLAWMSLLQTLTCGLGMWFFLRHGLRLSYWPAAVASWCAPLTGFMTLWQGYPLLAATCWLPWLLLLAHHSVKAPWGWSTLCLAGVTALLVLSGGSDVGGLVLITTGLYALWLLATDELRRRQWRRAASAALAMTVAWLLGFFVAAPYVLPMFEYVRTGARIQARIAGSEERPPGGLSELPAIVLPDVHGSDRPDSLLIANGNRLESSAGACAGLLAVFWLAPLAWCHRGLRRQSLFFTLLAAAGLGWTLGLPGFVDVFRMWPLTLFSFNRWVFATSSSVLVLAAIGLESLRNGPPRFQRRFVVPMLLTAVFGLWCLFRCFELPEPLHSQIETAIRRGGSVGLSLDRLRAAQRTFSRCYAVGALLSLAAEAGWLTTFWSTRRLVWCRLAIIVLLPVQLFLFAWQERRQADRVLYFPRVAALEKLTALPPGRIWGIDCLPPNLSQFHGLDDIRGYDAVDPSSFVKLFNLACAPPRSPPTPYAVTQEALPMLLSTGHRLKLHPVADLLNVRYLVLRTPPPIDFPLVVHQDDYWVVENRDALPRAFVPRSVRVVGSDQEALAMMQSRLFNPRETVLMSTDPKVGDAMQGTAAIRYETPTRASVAVDLRTDGIVVISDLWDPGWRAALDGTTCPIHRVDIALRGLRVPSGKHTIELTYDPSSVRLGFQIAAAGGLLLLLWSAGLVLTTTRVHLPPVRTLRGPP